MLVAPYHAITLAPLPRVPSASLIYKTTLTTGVSENTSTFSAVNVGVPHPKRLVIIGFLGAAVDVTGTILGFPIVTLIRVNAFMVAAAQVPVGTVGDIVATAGISVNRKALSVYVAYPQSHRPLDNVGIAGVTGTTDAVVADVKVMAGGFLVYCGGQGTSVGSFTTTWSGPDPVVENADILIGAAAYTSGNVNASVSSDLDDLTLAESITGTKHLAVASWGPPSPGN